MPYQISSYRFNRYQQRRDKCQYHHQFLVDDDNDMILFSGKQDSKPISPIVSISGVNLIYPSSNESDHSNIQSSCFDIGIIDGNSIGLDFCLDD